jgi:hypothetical protein
MSQQVGFYLVDGILGAMILTIACCVLQAQTSGLGSVIQKLLQKIGDAKVFILSTFDGVELMTGIAGSVSVHGFWHSPALSPLLLQYFATLALKQVNLTNTRSTAWSSAMQHPSSR